MMENPDFTVNLQAGQKLVVTFSSGATLEIENSGPEQPNNSLDAYDASGEWLTSFDM